ncbi:MAG: hypothetical protein IKC73_04395 [Clostridia bacterium]|nr:hypothetical protein [Clostridia bacterium]
MKDFQVGYASVDITPPLGSAINGYYVPRYAKGILDPLTASALALTLGEQTVVLMSIDNCLFSRAFVHRCNKAIEKATGLSGDCVMITATHTHTGPFCEPTTMFETDDAPILAYGEFLVSRVADAVALALDDRHPARMGYIVGTAPERVAYIRRYKMKDGTTMTCPPIDDPNIDHPIGTLDQRVNVLRFDREGAPTVILMNYGLHADCVNGELLSPDWPCEMAKTLEKALDGVKTMFISGAAGDVGSTNVHPKDGDMNDTEISFDNEMKSPGMARFVGRALAGTVLQVYDKVKYVPVERLKIQKREIAVAANVPAREDLPRAHEYKRLHDMGRDDLIPYSAMELTTVVAEALRMCRLENGPESFPMDLTGVVIGEVALLGIPGEPFTDIGVGIKKTEGYGLILPCALSGGYEGYFPMQSAYDEGGYEARTSVFRAGVAETIVKEGRTLLTDMKEA